ncbi:response regulator [Limisalsivibrio acetivorans]|uniref:response regulator n=1 Tax=Limisalsivibrio acetivorans TaxID=1304888 RepID=UPI0003B5B9F3|nr:response regulator [Limisalsivibrio acetivorans]
MKRILLAEDDLPLRKQICFSLEMEYEIKEASNRKEALCLLGDFEPDIAIVDLGLPPSENTPDEGIKLMQDIQENSRCKIIVLTGQKSKEAALQSIKTGTFDYIIKPVNMEKLIFSIERAILFMETEREIEQEGVEKISFNIKMGEGLQPLREEAEKSLIIKVLKDNEFNVYKSAKILGVKRESLYYFIKKFGLER